MRVLPQSLEAPNLLFKHLSHLNFPDPAKFASKPLIIDLDAEKSAHFAFGDVSIFLVHGNKRRIRYFIPLTLEVPTKVQCLSVFVNL